MAPKGEKTTYYYKLFRVKRSDGRVTTVSVDPVLVAKACQILGGLKPVAKRVREAAYAYAEGSESKSCSGFVQSQLRTDVLLGRSANASNGTDKLSSVPAPSVMQSYAPSMS